MERLVFRMSCTASTEMASFVTLSSSHQTHAYILPLEAAQAASYRPGIYPYVLSIHMASNSGPSRHFPVEASENPVRKTGKRFGELGHAGVWPRAQRRTSHGKSAGRDGHAWTPGRSCMGLCAVELDERQGLLSCGSCLDCCVPQQHTTRASTALPQGRDQRDGCAKQSEKHFAL